MKLAHIILTVVGVFSGVTTLVSSQTKAQVPRPSVIQPMSLAVPVPSSGATVFRQCSTCHTLKAGQRNMVGPNLGGFFGKRVGASNPSFRYSTAFTNSTLVWSDQTLDQFLTNPRRMIPGTSMSNGAITDAAKRAALIEFLKRETQ